MFGNGQDTGCGSAALSTNDNPGYAFFPPLSDQHHLEQGLAAAALPTGSHALLRALVSGLPASLRHSEEMMQERGVLVDH